MHEASHPAALQIWQRTGFRGFVSLIIAATLLHAPASHADPQFAPLPSFDRGAAPASFAPASLPASVEPVKVTPPSARLTLHAPDGFQVGIFAEGLEQPRDIAVAPNGDIFVSQIGEGSIVLLRDIDGDGASDMQVKFAEGFRQPSGLVVRSDGLYVVDLRAVWRLAYKQGDAVPSTRMMVTRPGALGAAASRPAHSLVFPPDGKRFYVTVGPQNDVAEESLPHGSIQKFHSDGSAQTTYDPACATRRRSLFILTRASSMRSSMNATACPRTRRRISSPASAKAAFMVGPTPITDRRPIRYSAICAPIW